MVEFNEPIIQRAWSRLMPPQCRLCKAPGYRQLDLCRDCWNDLPRLGPQCIRCAEALPQAGICGRCQRDPPSFDAVLTPFTYQQPLDFFIGQLKFSQQRAYARLLSHLWLIDTELDRRPEALIAVPLDPRRLAQRGFNQANLLAKLLAKRLAMDLQSDLVKKVRSTAAQTNLDASARRKNLRGSFAIKTRARLPRHVAIVDDVMTTGATANELAQLLRQAGVDKIDVWVCARA